jgi:transposase
VRPPTHARELTEDERTALEAGLRSSDAFVLRRCQVLLANARGERASTIARAVGCSVQAVHNILRAFDTQRLGVLQRRPSRPRRIRAAFSPERAEQLRTLLHQRPRDFGKPTSLWTLELAAEVSFEQGLTAARVSDETIRATLARLGVTWQRAKRWIESPDPAYRRKKGRATA